MSVIRAFIAIELSAEIQDGLQQASNTLQSRTGTLPVRWVPVKNIHLTLVFLGMSPRPTWKPSRICCVQRLLVFPCLRFRSSPGCLSSFRKPRVIWIGVSAPPDLSCLQHRIAQASARLGYPAEDRPFSPHLTLGGFLKLPLRNRCAKSVRSLKRK